MQNAPHEIFSGITVWQREMVKFFGRLPMMFAKVQLAPSHWSLFGSIIAHAVILWFIMRVPIFNPLLPPLPFSVRLAEDSLRNGKQLHQKTQKGK
jgi:hypothetical protein